METITRDLKPLFISAVVVTVLCLILVWNFGTLAEASPPKPTQQDINNLTEIKANQRQLALIRKWNQSEVDALAKNGWAVQWSKNPDDLKLVPFTK